MDRTLRDRTPWVLLASLAFVSIVVVGYAGFTATTAFGPYTTTWEGTSELRTMADAGDRTLAMARNASAYEDGSSNETVAIVLAPDEAYGAQDAARVRAFVEDGGTLLVAAQSDGAGNRLLAEIGVSARVDGDPLRDETEHGPSPDFPTTTAVGDHPILDGADAMTLNHGSAIDPGTAAVLVESSPFAYLDRDRDGDLDEDETLARYPAMTVEPVGEGEVIVVSDPSVFVNAMLEYEDNRRVLDNTLAGHRTVLIDVSHDAALPPFVLATLLVRESVLAQATIAAAAFAGIWLLGRRSFAPLDGWWWNDAASDEGDGLSPAQIRSYLERQHPDWDADRIERVTRAVVADPEAMRSPGDDRS